MMQNRYSGDLGDFSKLGLLRHLSQTGLSIGLNWYLVPDEDHNNDGMHTGYLSDHSFEACDPDLWKALYPIAHGNRCISALEETLDAKFYRDLLDFRGLSKDERSQVRDRWHRNALECLKGCQIICVDPDNGLMTKSAAGKTKSNKYVLSKELHSYYSSGSSVIYYQHKARKPDQYYIDQHKALLSNFVGATGTILKFTKTSLRYYCFIIRPEHQDIINDSVGHFLSSRWGAFFTTL